MKYQGLIFLLLFTRLKTIESAEPVINNAINEIKVSYCSTQEYKLDANAYSDAEDGNLGGGKLTLKLLDASAATFVPNDEKPVQLVGTSLFIVPVSTTQSELNLILRVMDTSGSFKDDRFKVTFNNKISVREISFHFTLSKVTTGDVQIQDLFNFYQALKDLTTWKTRNFGLSEITNVADKKKEVAVFDCGMTQSTCPLQTILNLINDVKDQNPGPTYTLNFDSKMAAIDLQASGFRWEKFDRCIGVSGVPDRDINLEFWSFAGIQAIDRTQVIQVEIPDGGFTYESIKQSTMTLEIQSGRNDPTIAFDNFWIGAELEGSKWIIYAVRTDRFYEYISLTGNFFEHKGILYAQVFVSASVLLPISVERNDYYMSVENTTKPMNNYIVEFSVGITGIAKHIYPKQINIFLSKLFVTFGTSYKELIYVNDYVIESFDGRNGDGVIRWSLMMDKCDFDRIEFIRSKMFESGSQEEINNDFKLRMKREYDLRSIKETLSGDCNLSKPKQSSPIGPYQISYCGINSFKLADDTFIDEEDGNLAKLTAKMTTEQNKPIGSDDIIQFDTATKIIYGLLPSTYNPPLQREITYKLVVTDSSNLSTETVVKFIVSDDSKTIPYSISITTKFTAQSTSFNQSPGLALAFKVGNYFGDNGNGFSLVSSQTSSDGNQVIKFGNCTWSTPQCDFVNLNFYKNKLLATSTSLNALLDLKPEFEVLNVEEVIKPPCDKDNPPEVSNPLQDLSVTTCATFIINIPANTFNDVEQGNTRNLDLSIHFSGLQFGQTEMLHFQETTQIIAIVAAESDLNSYNFELKATDIGGNQAIDSFSVQVQKEEKEPSHIFTFQFRILKNDFQNYVELYSFVRRRFKEFFGDSETDNTFQIYKTEKVSSGYGKDSVHIIEWSNCTITRDECKKEQIERLKSRVFDGDVVKNEFKQSFETHFFILALSFKLFGVCDVDPPVVQNPIPDQNLGFCGPLTYQIPENTFKDSNDGNTRALQLKMTFENGEQIPDTFFVQFNEEEQTIYGVLAAEKVTTLAGEYSFTIIAKNSKEKTAKAILKLTIDSAKKTVSHVFKLNFSWKERQSQIEVLSKVANKLATFFDFSGNFYIYNYRVLTTFGSLTFTTCNAKYSPCDRDLIAAIESKAILNGQPSDSLRESLGNKYTIFSFRRLLIGDFCLPQPKKPTYVKPFQPFTIEICKTFRRNFDSKTFVDEEDVKLTYLVTKIDNNFVNAESSWISVDSSSHQFIGIVPTNIFSATQSLKYNASVRAIDSNNMHADGDVLVTVRRAQINSFYIFESKIKLKDSQLTSPIDIKMKFSDGVNRFFGSDAAMSISGFEANNDIYTIRWQNCLMVTSCINEAALQILKSNIIQGENQPVQDFSDALSEFDVLEMGLNIADVCKTDINPPTSKDNPLEVRLPICGGFVYQIPEDQFTDTEDGNTRSLEVFLTTDTDSEVNIVYNWMAYDVTKQTLTGYPTLFEATLFNQEKKKLILTARDKTGLTSKVDLVVTFKEINEPKFFFVIGMITQETSEMVKNFELSEKISEYLKDSNNKNIGIKSITSNELKFFNCSISYSPCDWASLIQIKSALATDNIPNPGLKELLMPKYDITYVSVEYDLPCKDDGVNPPSTREKINIEISICEWIDFVVPENTFYDLEDGNTRKLQLSFQSTLSQPFDNWILFKQQDQKFHINTLANVAINQPPEGYSFSVIATDSSSRTASTEMKIKITGPFSILEECKLKMSLTILNQLTMSSISLMRMLISKMAIYFQIKTEEIGAVDFQIDSQMKQVTFFWSFCSDVYRRVEYQTNSKALMVDYYNFIVKILLKLYQNDRKTIRSKFLQSFGSEIQVNEVIPMFSGRCQNLPPIVYPGTASLQMDVYYYGYSSQIYQNTIFYDFEDGWTHSLHVTMRNSNRASLFIDSWINVDNVSYNIYAVANSFVRSLTTYSFTYYLYAQDSGGLETNIAITVNIIKSTLNLSPFRFSFIYIYRGSPGQVFVSQTVYLIQKFMLHYTITSNQIVTFSYTVTYGNLNYRLMIWSVLQQDCQSNIYLSTASMRSLSDGSLNQNFVNQFKDFMDLKNIFISTTCQPKTEVVINYNITLPQITFCQVFSYQLKYDLFYDPVDGGMSNMQLQLMNENGMLVSKSSWLQINPTSLQLYGVAIRRNYRRLASQKFQLKVTNGRGVTNSLAFEAVISDEPFTTDCPITMSFTYKYLTESTQNIDVLTEMIRMLQKYYNDQEVNIKVLSFQRVDSTFTMVWSNCSSSFRSTTLSTAKNGYTEENRQKIKFVFDKIYMNGQIKQEFQTFMSQWSLLISFVSVSYCCIEKGPVAKENEIRLNVDYCKPVNYIIPEDMFNDECDGSTRNLQMKLFYANNQEIDSNEWIQLNKEQAIFGIVTEVVKMNSPQNGYRYLLKAFDYSGRSTSISVIVNIIGNIPEYEAYFVTGYSNTNNEMVSTTQILYETYQHLVGMIDSQNQVDSPNIFIKEFQYPEVITWTKCELSECDHGKVTSILDKFQIQRYDAIPNTKFIESASSEMTPYWIQSFIFNQQCGSGIIIITVNPEIPKEENKGNCEMFTYQIPSNLFVASTQMDSRNFMMTARFVGGQSITTSSLIQFNQAKQTFYGYAVSYLMQSSSFQMEVTATHPQSGQKASTEIKINFPNKTITDNLNETICLINTTLISKYRAVYPDVDILSKFSQLITTYIKTSNIEIVWYKRQPLNNSVWSILWTDCFALYTFYQNKNGIQYFNTMRTTISSLIQSNGELNQDFQQFLQKYEFFKFINITTSEGCGEPPNTPPDPKTPVEVLMPDCGAFEFPLEEDAFVDGIDGNTRNLDVEMMFVDGKAVPEDYWIVLNKTQFFVGSVNKEIIENQPEGGYEFKLVARDSGGLSSTMKMKVKHSGKQLPNPDYKFNVVGKIAEDFQSEVISVIKIEILKAVSNYVRPNQVEAYKTFYFQTFTVGDKIRFTVSQCKECDPFQIAPFELMDKSKAESIFESIVNVEDANAEIFDKCDIIKTVNPDFQLEMKYCEYYRYSFVQQFGEYFKNQLDYKLTDKNGNDFPRDYFLYFNKDELTVEAFPTPQIWNDAPTIYEFHFLVTFAFQPNTPAKFLYNLTVPEVRTFPKTADYSIVIQTLESQELPDGYFISKTLNNIRKIINDNEGNITFYNFQRLSTDPFQYRIDWKICIVGEKCDSSFVKNITEKLLNNELQPSDDIVAVFSPDSIQNIETECENRPPTAMKNYTIVIKPCGHFIYQLPRSLAKDEEDGDLYSMSIQLKNKDGSSLDRTSWVQLNEETKSIIAIPTAKAYESLLQTPLNFLLLITDTEGKSIETILILTGEEKSSDSYYSTTITFQNNLGTNAPFVEIQIVILRNIASTNSSNSLDDYRLVDFKKLASDESSYQMIYSICKIDETVCVPEDNEIKTSEKQLQNDDGNPSSELVDKLSPDILLKDIQFTKRYTIDEVPKTAEDSIKLAVDSCCHSRLYCLENDIFVDKEDGDIKNLKLSLMRRDTSPNSDFVGLVDDCIYVVSYQNFLPGIYNFVLEAQDKCNNTKPINIEVEVLKKCKDEFGVEFSVDIEKPAGEKIDQKDVYRIKSELEKYFSTEDNIAVISKEEQTSGKYTLNLGYCTLDINACDLKSVEQIISKLDENGESELTSILKIMNIELQDINIERKGDCTKPPFPPPESKLEKLEFNVTYCEHMDVKMAEDTFFNQEGLSTRDFQLQLLKVDGKDVGKDSWIQLNKTSQSIYGYIRFSDNQNQPKAFNYTLFVRKNEQDRGLKVPLCVYVIGEEPVLDYQMNIKSTILGDPSIPNVYYEIEIIKLLASFFGRGPLNNLGLARSSSSLNEIESFKFSFCNARKKSCDCVLIRETQSKSTDGNGISSISNDLFLFREAETIVQGKCSESKAPVINKDIIDFIQLRKGEIFEVSVPENAFTDDEDGGMSNLTLCIKDNQNRQLDKTSWMKVNQEKICGVYTLNEQRNQISTNKLEKFNLVAKDGCGKEAYNTFTVILQESEIKASASYCLIIDENIEQFKKDCSKVENIVEIIAEKFIIPESDVIITKIISKDENKTQFEWQIPNSNDITCTVQEKSSKQILPNGNVDNDFVLQLDKVNVKVEEILIKCVSTDTIKTPDKSEFPWWVIILLIVILVLLFLIWCLWLFIPRCCKENCCLSLFCERCCTKSGRFSSLNNENDPDYDENKEPNVDSIDGMPMVYTKFNKESDTSSNPSTKGELVDGKFSKPKEDETSMDSGQFSDPLELPPLYDHQHGYIDSPGNIQTSTTKTITNKRTTERDFNRIDERDVKLDFNTHRTDQIDQGHQKSQAFYESWKDPQQTNTDYQSIRYVNRQYKNNQTPPGYIEEFYNDNRQATIGSYAGFNNYEERRYNEQRRARRAKIKRGDDHLLVRRNKSNRIENEDRYRRNYHIIDERNLRQNLSYGNDHSEQVTVTLSKLLFNKYLREQNLKVQQNSKYKRYYTKKRSRNVDALVDNRYMSSGRNNIYCVHSPGTSSSNDIYIADTATGYTSDTSDRNFYIMRRKKQTGDVNSKNQAKIHYIRKRRASSSEV